MTCRIEFDQPPGDWLPATLVAPSDPLVEDARAACRTVLGTEPTSAVFPGTTDATWFERDPGSAYPAGPRSRPAAPRPRRRRVGVDRGDASGGRDLHPPRYGLLFPRR